MNTPTYKLAKFLVPILKPLATNEFAVKDSFHFAEEIVDQQHDLITGSFDVDSLFTNIPLQETIEICTNELFKECETVEGLIKTEFKELLSLATKDSHFIFDGTLYKPIDGVAMENKENKKFLLELKESLLIMRDKPSLNRKIRSAPLYLFDKV